MFLKLNWPSQRFVRTDSEHNFILFSERFNLTRVTLCVSVIPGFSSQQRMFASAESLPGRGMR